MSNDDDSIAEFLRLVGTELRSACVPLYFVIPGEPYFTVIGGQGGCSVAVATSAGRFFITCHHVLKGFEQRKKADSRIMLAGSIAGAMCLLQPYQVVEQSDLLDIAILSVPTNPYLIEPPAEHRERYYKLTEFPIPAPSPGELVHVIGYPAKARNQGQEDYVHLAFSVSSISDLQCKLYPEFQRTGSSESRLMSAEGTLEGMSGSPAFFLRDKGPPVLFGFFYQGKTAFDTIHISRLSYLKPDMHIDWPMVPQDFKSVYNPDW